MEQQKNTLAAREMAAVAIGIVLVIVVMLYFGLRNTSSDESITPLATDGAEEPAEKIPTIAIEEIKKRFFANSALFIDIRSKEEYDTVHIPGAISVPVAILPDYQLTGDKSIFIVWSAADQKNADTANRILKDKGSPYAFLAGGIEEWENAGGTLITFGYQNSFIDQSKVTLLSAEELKPYIDEELVPSYIIDVRKKDMFDRGHIKNAVSIPLAELERHFREIPAATNIVVYGETNVESFQAAVRLFDLNFWSVRALRNGFEEWKQAKYPIENGA